MKYNLFCPHCGTNVFPLGQTHLEIKWREDGDTPIVASPYTQDCPNAECGANLYIKIDFHNRYVATYIEATLVDRVQEVTP